jgi:type II restriction/modification system DNA methylase subunit YeeA
MNKANLKSYAPEARKDFIAAVTARANLLGLSDKAGQLDVAPAQTQGDVTLIAGQAWPAKVATQRDQLMARMRREGFAHTCEAVAYTWFNRFAALRYMELHDYLGHGHRALSSVEGALPDILTHAADLAQSGTDSGLPGLNANQVLEMKLAGNRDGELYRMLLVAQCNALSNAMPFLFERIDDDTELLLPDNLLRTDSVIAKLVQAIPEEDWAEVEIIGWLYQFYISEKKDQVIGKVVKSEDIPAATQLFTPNWIVQYLVQNSVGRLWLMANPASTLASQWPYYIQPAEQTPEVQAQLDALIQTRMDEDGGSLNPETITVLDPACGSGHILVVAYDVLKAIYLERGYRVREIPRLILEKNLYGLDIDDRAAQMAGFALLMKARADDRRLFNEPPKLNVLSLQESKGLDAAALAQAINTGSTERVDTAQLLWLIETFEHAKTFGSLIQVDQQHTPTLRKLLLIMQQAMQAGDLYAQAAALDVLSLVQQALMLGMQFDAVVANPPYMGSKYHTPAVKSYLKNYYSGFEKDLFSAFAKRNTIFGKPTAEISLMTSNVWMFLSSYEDMRRWLIENKTINTLIQLSNSGFDGATVFICSFTFSNHNIQYSLGSYIRLIDFSRPLDQGPKTLEAIRNHRCGWFFNAYADNFKKIPSSPIAYWLSESKRKLFDQPKISNIAKVGVGMQTGENAKYIRYWFEVDVKKTELKGNIRENQAKWFPCNKGGEFRKWFGNVIDVINWEQDGSEIKNFATGAYIRNEEGYFKPALTWSRITSGELSFRFVDSNCIHNDASCFITGEEDVLWKMLDYLNSKIAGIVIGDINPTLNLLPGQMNATPYLSVANSNGKECVEIARADWNAFEISWDFAHSFFIGRSQQLISEAWSSWNEWCEGKRQDMLNLEEQNNRLFINAYDLQEELTPEVPESQITLARADREKDCQHLISYAIGCMMGRYSLDEPGLIYAHAGNVGFAPSRYTRFTADADGILPITDEHWFDDDAPTRVRDFLQVVWGPNTLAENMAWLAESLGSKASETPEETIRRYMADKLYKDHLQTYKKRPIYWLFSSGKQGAFQALVYLHRYTEGTLARLRAEYVVPLTSKMQSRIDMLQKDALAARSTAARNKLNKDVEKLKKKHAELLAYDEQLRHYADMRITLDLDDGVKVNYGKFGDLLEGVKIVTGGAGDE